MTIENEITTEERGRRKERRGIVVSDKMDKTVVVRVDILKPPSLHARRAHVAQERAE